jgi:hypothetical protein
MGYRLFHDPRYVPMLRKSGRGLEALLWGVEKLPEGEAQPLASEVMPNAGVATLRAPGSDFTVAVKFGPHGGGHGHYDKLSFVSFANGAGQGADAGTQAYAAKTHATWDKMTVAHNTIAVDERNQAEATGRLLEWMPRPFGTAVRLSAGPACAGVNLERTLVHTAAWMLDIFEASATDAKPHRFDWLYHNYGEGGAKIAAQPYAELPKQYGYQHLSDARAASTGDAWQAVFTQEGANLKLWMLGAPGTTVVTGRGLGPDLRVPVPFVMARRAGETARFVALHEPYAGTPRVRAFRQTGDGVYVIEREGLKEEVTVGAGRFAIRRIE